MRAWRKLFVEGGAQTGRDLGGTIGAKLPSHVTRTAIRRPFLGFKFAALSCVYVAGDAGEHEHG